MSKRILIVEDNLDVLDVLKEALEYEGYQIYAVEETEDIVSLVKRFQPDLLLIDFLLTGINGGELCGCIKREQCIDNLPVIMMSAYPKVIASLGYYGCDDFIPKPFDLNDLLVKINHLTNS